MDTVRICTSFAEGTAGNSRTSLTAVHMCLRFDGAAPVRRGFGYLDCRVEPVRQFHSPDTDSKRRLQ
jgi:hypothetical protein